MELKVRINVRYVNANKVQRPWLELRISEVMGRIIMLDIIVCSEVKIISYNQRFAFSDADKFETTILYIYLIL